MEGCLNFHDDKSHVRVYSVPELKQIFEECGCTILKSGIRRNYYYIAAMPFRIIWSLLKNKKLNANLFWDICGFAEFLAIRKN
jgi:hypothetical protein